MSLTPFRPLTEDYFRAGVSGLIATLSKYHPNAEDAKQIHGAWARLVFPACHGREHWRLALDRLMVEFKDMPRPADALEILEQVQPAYTPPPPEDEKSLPYISANQEELAREYLDWRVYAAKTTIREDLRLWEHHRFGQELHPSAHAVLLCAVLVEAFPEDPRSRIIRGTQSKQTT